MDVSGFIRNAPYKLREQKEYIIGRIIRHEYFPEFITENLLTYSRAVMGIMLFVFMMTGFYGFLESTLTGLIFIELAITYGFISDLFDGPISRMRKSATEMGAFVDSFADKILVLPLVAYYLWNYDFFLVMAICAGEGISQIFRLWFGYRGRDMEANILGQIKVWVQAAGIYLLSFGYIAGGDRVLYCGIGLGCSSLIIQAREYGLFYRFFRWASQF